jgi:hypothetical protein
MIAGPLAGMEGLKSTGLAKATQSADANRRLHYEYRKPWKL